MRAVPSLLTPRYSGELHVVAKLRAGWRREGGEEKGKSATKSKFGHSLGSTGGRRQHERRSALQGIVELEIA